LGARVGDRRVDVEAEYREFAEARATQRFRIAYLMCGDWHEAEDLVQSTLAKLFVAWSRVREVESADAYARRTLLNTFLAQRRLKRSSEMPVAHVMEATSAPGVDADLRMTLIAALRRLPSRSRAVVVLRYVEDHSIESVAELLGATPSAVKSLNTRGLAQLRELLGTEREQLFQP
jgi:RNA polymerase sigma-70 factor (sigma-E family)